MVVTRALVIVVDELSSRVISRDLGPRDILQPEVVGRLQLAA